MRTTPSTAELFGGDGEVVSAVDAAEFHESGNPSKERQRGYGESREAAASGLEGHRRRIRQASQLERRRRGNGRRLVPRAFSGRRAAC